MNLTWLFVIAAALLGAFLLVTGRYLALWFQAYVSGARVGLISLMLMPLRKVSPSVIVQCKIMAVQAGLPRLPTSAIETQYLAGGDVRRVTFALIAAHRAGIELDWDTAAAIDLAGRDIVEAVRVSVNPKVIHCPETTDGAEDSLYGVAQDGIQLTVRVRVTVRTNLSQLVGGATESTVIARVGQGIISSIGSCKTYLEALSDPAIISRQVIEKQLDSQTAFSIVSIDIADIDVGRNIGAKLQIDEANAEIRVARAEAEKRRAMAVAHQQQMKAMIAENRAKVVLAEAEVPVAIADALRAGRLRTGRRATGSAKAPTQSFYPTLFRTERALWET